MNSSFAALKVMTLALFSSYNDKPFNQVMNCQCEKIIPDFVNKVFKRLSHPQEDNLPSSDDGNEASTAIIFAFL